MTPATVRRHGILARSVGAAALAVAFSAGAAPPAVAPLASGARP